MTKLATSPVAAGPGGTHFEAKVGAYYLLALLLDGEPRGLPGARIERVHLQGAGDGFPLDDVVVHGAMPDATPVVIEIQAKRKITFSPADKVFSDVVEQIVRAVEAGDLEAIQPTALAIATSQSSRQIDGAYQEVLLWARYSESADAFFRKLTRAGASNDNMRTFVSTLRTNVARFGGNSDEDGIWKILRQLQILVFDFSEHGQTESLVRDRCAQALEVTERGKAGALWSALCDMAQSIATAGGEIAAPALRGILKSTHGLKLAGLRQNRAARAVLLEASQNALNEIRNRVGSTALSRRARLESVNISLDGGRYLEILGDAGVGKSGILRALAEQEAIGANIIVLSPTRTIPRGWVAMRQAIGFDGSAKDLLSDIAASGGATLFLDGVDFFGELERATATDLVRETAFVPGFNVVITARRSFGTEDPNWLPLEAIDKLGRAPAVTVDELSNTEIDELRSAAPELRPLLADGHPAREVVRNLFRLDRLIGQASGEPVPHTEAEMAMLWWQTGDGKSDDLARDRTRILRGVADKSLSGNTGPLDTSAYLAPPLNMLVKSGTLRDLGGERMIFRHDVFRDWAIANRLHEHSAKIVALPLSQPAPPSLARGVDLAARLAIEGSPDAKIWKTLLDQLSQPNVHGSWPRAVIIALVRSEASGTVLARAEAILLADSGRLLRELIRMLMAIDVRPAGRLLEETGVPFPDELAGVLIPVGPTWRRLVVWILGLEDRLPQSLIPDVAELYASYATSTFAIDPVVPQLVAQLHAWLTEIEVDDDEYAPSKRHSLGGDLSYERRHSLHEYLRSSFIALCGVQPSLAEKYLRFLLDRNRRSGRSAESVVMSPGGLTKASPKLLADLTAATLIGDKEPKLKRREPLADDFPRTFTHLDRDFLSPSPARGPFLDLLVHAPREGAELVRQIVEHACTFGKDASHPGDDPLLIEFDSGIRRFPYPDSYFWSRQATGHYCVTSALMALEAWGHRRIDAGESVEIVLADILSNGELPAAYLLVVTDLLLSHWPQSRKAAIPFVGCPELLSWDRTRQTHDYMPFDLGRFGKKEPPAFANLDSLRKRPSRGISLEQTLPYYLFVEPLSDGEAVRARLEKALSRLGPYETDSSMADPRLMAVHALNLLDRNNYQTHTRRGEAGKEQIGYEYVPPASEMDHLAPMQAEMASRMAATALRGEAVAALEHPEKSSTDLVARCIVWARQADATGELQPDYDHSVLISAALLMRDGQESQRYEHGEWAKAKLLAVVISATEDPVHRFRDGLRFNPLGIATVGMIAVVKHSGGLSESRPLLDLASRGDPAAARGFGTELSSLSAIDSRLPKSLLRCAFAGNIRARLVSYGPGADLDATRKSHVAEFRKQAVEAEWRWLQGAPEEPAWPTFPSLKAHIREPLRLGEAPPKPRLKQHKVQEYYVDHQAAAVWLLEFAGAELTAPDWLRQVATQYHGWTSTANGAGLERREEISTTPTEWNMAYYRLVARSLSGLAAADIDDICLDPVVCLPDQSFLDAMATLLVSIDVVYLDAGTIAECDVLRIRKAFARRIQETSRWKSFKHRPGYGAEFHLERAVGAVFMTGHGLRAPPQCYVPVASMPRVVSFIPLLTELAAEAPSLLTALLALSIAKVSIDIVFLKFCVTAMHACMKRFPDDTRLWLDYGIGKQFCALIERVLKANSSLLLTSAGLRPLIDEIVSSLIRLGNPDAAAVENTLSQHY